MPSPQIERPTGWKLPLYNVGVWAHPVSSFPARSTHEVALQVRAGLVSVIMLVTGVGLTVAMTVLVLLGIHVNTVRDPLGAEAVLLSAAMLGLISVFAPHAVIRTQGALVARQILDKPSMPLRPWETVTVTFDAVLVGGLLAALYVTMPTTFAVFGVLLMLRAAIETRRRLPKDANARYHSIVGAWTLGLSGAIAYLIVNPLTLPFGFFQPIWPMILGAVVALYAVLAVNAIQRWVNASAARWSFARESVDPRRLGIALVAAAIAWASSYAGETIGTLAIDMPDEGDLVGALAGLTVFLASWALLWLASVALWRRDALRLLAAWRKQQAQIIARLADGSLSPDLAARAALPTVTRVATYAFGASRAMVLVELPDGRHYAHVTGVDRFEQGAPAQRKDLSTPPNLRIPLANPSEATRASAVTLSDWLTVGGILTRSPALVSEFADLATTALTAPLLATDRSSNQSAFADMFDSRHYWPTLSAFQQATLQLQARADASPQSTSLVVGVMDIEDFGALSGGKFEQSAVAQVVRLALGFDGFAGAEVFIAYQSPGRIWVALLSGPMVRQAIAQLKALQVRINDHGSIPSQRVDLDVQVSVALGYAAHQVDSFELDQLITVSEERLEDDLQVRSNYLIDTYMPSDFSPEDITGAAIEPATIADLAQRLSEDAQHHPENFVIRLKDIRSLDGGSVNNHLLTIGWTNAPHGLDLSEPSAFRAATSRNVATAALAAGITSRAIRAHVDHLTAQGDTTTSIMAPFPAPLLDPETGTNALPNLLSRSLDRASAYRTIALIDEVPPGCGQAALALGDYGIRIACDARAALNANPSDLTSWHRFAVVFPSTLANAQGELDDLIVQQTVSTLTTRGTKLIAEIDSHVDIRELAKHRIGEVIEPSPSFHELESSDSSSD